MPHDFVYVAAGFHLIVSYLGADFVTKNKSFFHWADKGPIPGEMSSSLVVFAEKLFALRNSEGFDNVLNRFKGREVRASFFEVYAADMFLRAGFSVRFRPETGIKKQDFDFIATTGNEEVNAEVTAFTSSEFSFSTINNSLNAKRKQLPKDRPAVLFCVYPGEWQAQINVATAFRETAHRFLHSTRRINCIIFLGEVRVEITNTDKRGVLFQNMAVANDNPYHPTKALQFFHEHTERSRQAQGASSMAEFEEALKKYRVSDFHKWVEFERTRTF